MAGSIYRKPSGLWVLRVYAGRDPLTGKKVWKSDVPGHQARGHTPADGGAGPPPAPTMSREEVERIIREHYGIELVASPPDCPQTNV